MKSLNKLIKDEGIVEYIHDYYAAVNSRLSVMGNISHNMTDQKLYDLSYIEKTYIRSGYEQLLSRINQKQMWVLDEANGIKAYAGIHKDGSLGFEFVAPDARRKNLASRMQSFIANQMIKNNMIPYVMIS